MVRHSARYLLRQDLLARKFIVQGKIAGFSDTIFSFLDTSFLIPINNTIKFFNYLTLLLVAVSKFILRLNSIFFPSEYEQNPSQHSNTNSASIKKESVHLFAAPSSSDNKKRDKPIIDYLWWFWKAAKEVEASQMSFIIKLKMIRFSGHLFRVLETFSYHAGIE